MPLSWLLERFAEHRDQDAVVWQDRATKYGELLDLVERANEFLAAEHVLPGQCVMLDADFSPGSIALLLAVMQNRNIIVPVARQVTADRDKYAQLAEVSHRLSVDENDQYTRTADAATEVTHPLLVELKESGSPGLVLFSSGSTGEPKAAVHNLDFLLNKFKMPRHSQRMITFLLFDHIGGFNTMMYTLSNHGCVITVTSRDAATICRAVEQHRAEVLPTSPTFLNLLLVSGEHEKHDLSSLKIINYATEVMPPATLRRLNDAFPGVTFRQSYGMTELGIMRTQSRSNDSVWIRVGGEDYQTRIVDGILHIKAKSSMLGYLNAPSPFDDEGWFNTQDEVEVDGEWLRFKGRKSEIINVGGEKVYPAEVETVLMEDSNVADATVTKEPHAIMGNIVVAELTLHEEEPLSDVIKRVRQHCFTKLPSYKIPVKIRLSDATSRMSERFKKQRTKSE
ncbi:fatty acid--CoA ligase family protein [Aeoliella sp. ICT_H6.2]|uniref:Fatty acid--CoA ligase family protein n=1 Tax=Aeoliella straminimaris TaxID=2954799 RepID=A0A9X2FHH9_9BACT|nr:fatty acid--CoA ligase family protein [Aeoliella straminimaris]MCO6044956.1 fatty acid--CoA ligase family protein [Aeoliella straminimaris]